MIDMSELEQVIDEFADAVREELGYKLELAGRESKCELVKACILFQAESEGLINGKNTDARDRQQADILVHNQAVKSAEADVLEWKRYVVEAQVWRVKMEARIGLTKAWLYSQARIG